MKNTIMTTLIALIIILVFTVNTALAEEFSVRNGIHFGMSKDEVIEAEDGLNFTEVKEIEKNPIGQNYLYSHPTSLAGIAKTDDYVDDITLYYYFNDNDELSKIAYGFKYNNETKGIFSTSKEALKKVEGLRTVLEEKYTIIDEIQNGKIEFYPYAGENSYIFANYMRDYSNFYKIHDWNRFVVESDDSGVDIHLWYMSHFSTDVTTVFIEYIYCSPSVYQNIIEDYGRVAREQETDL